MMKKSSIIWLVIGVCLILLGGVCFCITMSANHWNFGKLETVKTETRTIEITEPFQNINVDTDTEDIKFCLSKDGKTSVVFRERENEKHTTIVKNGTLFIKRTDDRKWFDYIGFTFEPQTITVYLSETEYDAIIVKETTGDIDISGDFTFGSIDLKVSTGDVNLKNVVATGAISLKLSTGNVRLDGCDGAEITVETNTGNVKGTLLTEKIFITKSDTGKISVPKSTSGGKCKITTDTGDIEIKIVD